MLIRWLDITIHLAQSAVLYHFILNACRHHSLRCFGLVRPCDYRRQNVGRMLVNHLLDFSRSQVVERGVRHCKQMELEGKLESDNEMLEVTSFIIAWSHDFM